ncbi:MAG: WD40 repeat domain-containing protein, partial [Ignavibacteriaceae bacterium]|nr:WD40 repeat domain-containing protein [Ignavibacteriaceae bacterium]
MKKRHIKYNIGLAKYFASKPLYLDKEEKKPQIRKAAEQPYQQTRAEMWGEVVDTLCDLLFIEAKCRTGLTFDLVKDYKFAYLGLPEAQPEIEEEKKRQERIDRWTKEIIEYSSKWNDRHAKKRRGEAITEPEPVLPEPPPTVRIWTDEEIEADTKRKIENPTRLDKFKAFDGFVASETYPLNNYNYMPRFVIQHAYNFAPAGPVHSSAKDIVAISNFPMILRQWKELDKYNPHNALIKTLQGHTDKVYNVGITPNGKRAVSGSSDKTFRVWDLESGKCLNTLHGTSHVLSSVHITPDGKKVVSGNGDKILRVWDIERGKCLYILEHTGPVNSVSITVDGKNAFSASNDNRFWVWDLESGKCLKTLERHAGVVSSVSVTPNGNRAVSGSWDGTLHVWDLENSKCLHMLDVHTGRIHDVSITPDGKKIVAASDDMTLRVWDIERGKCLKTLEGH